MILGPLYMILWLVVLVAAIVLVVRWLGGSVPATRSSTRAARDILDERFARGEIDQEEYEKRRKALNS